MPIAGIYVLHLSGTHYYGGRSKDVHNRFRNHLKKLRDGKHPNRHMQNVWNKHGQQLDLEVVLVVEDKEDRVVFEQHWLDCNVGQPGCLNVQMDAKYGGPPPMTPETRAKLSAAGKGRKLSEAHIAALRAHNTGKVCTVVTRAKLRSFNLGKKQDPATTEKIRASNTGKKRSAEFCLKQSGDNSSRGMLGKKASDETRAKQSAALKGRVKSPEEIENIRAAALGHVVTEETRAKISASKLGVKQGPRSEDTRRRMAEGQRKRRLQEKTTRG